MPDSKPDSMPDFKPDPMPDSPLIPNPAPRVLVTRSERQSSALAALLLDRGYQPVLLPTLALQPPSSWLPADSALDHLSSFHWLLWTSANAVHAAFDRYGSRLLLPTLRHAAIGQGTARTLQSFGIEVHLLPPLAVAESLAAALVPHLRQPSGAPTRLLLLRAEHGREALPDLLSAAGAHLTLAPVYRTVLPPESLALARDLFSHPAAWPAAATFTSGSTAQNLAALLSAAGLELPSSTLRVSIGPVTTAALRHLGWRVDAQAESATLPSLVDKLDLLLHSKS